MNYGFSTNLYDKEGDSYDDCILVHVGDSTIIKFKNAVELEDFAKAILKSLPEIEENLNCN